MNCDLSVHSNTYGNEIVGQESVDTNHNLGVKKTSNIELPTINSLTTDVKEKDVPSLQQPKVVVVDQNDANNLLNNIGDSITVLMGLLHKLMSEQRKQNSDLIAEQYANEKKENLAQAKEMEDSANKAFAMQIASAAVQGAISIASTALSFASAAKQISAAKDTIANANTGEQLNKNLVDATSKFNENKNSLTANLDKLAAKAELKNFKAGEALRDAQIGLKKAGATRLDAWRSLSDAGGNMTKNVLDAFTNRENSMSQAQVKKLEAEAQDIMAAIERLKEVQESIKDMQSKALETMDSVLMGERDIIKKMSV